MALCVPASHIGCCRVDLARGYSLLTSRQVEYVVEIFDLQNAKSTFDFVFRLYNFVALASENNSTLHDLNVNLAKLNLDVEGMGLSALTSRVSKCGTRGNGGVGNEPPKKQKNQGGDVESDTPFDVAILEALNRAGYAIPDVVEEFKPLLAVRVSFP